MNGSSFDITTGRIESLLSDLYEIQAVYRQGERLVFNLSSRYDSERSAELLKDRLRLAGFTFSLSQSGEGTYLQIDPKRRLRIPTLNLILFFVTLVSVYLVPVFLRNLQAAAVVMAGANLSKPLSFTEEIKETAASFPPALYGTLDDLAAGVGIVFTLALISTLFVHEMGHFLASRRRNIITSWPYFIPAPNIIGTFGAIIKSKSPFFNRRDLIEVGAAGPIAGWIVAVTWLLWGLSQSTVVPTTAFGLKEMAFSLDGESLLMRLAALNLIGAAPDGFYYRLTEAAFAGWVGMLVTAINLLPIGQLDGGHILYGLVKKGQFHLARLALIALLVLGLQSMMWWFFAGFGLLFGIKHPPTLDDSQPPHRGAVSFGIMALIILAVSFTPVPFR
ncbi:MAG TPA: site-2 protease family protein [Candidatus Deferrimicrobium sp.]|nr:site-2 protease family protein [Candidatus Deferrimicrobium sp.]